MIGVEREIGFITCMQFINTEQVGFIKVMVATDGGFIIKTDQLSICGKLALPGECIKLTSHKAFNGSSNLCCFFNDEVFCLESRNTLDSTLYCTCIAGSTGIIKLNEEIYDVAPSEGIHACCLTANCLYISTWDSK